MGIEIQCPQCDRKFRVPEKFAGKQVKCPKCQGVMPVPETGASDEPRPATARATLPVKPTPQQWRMQTEDGQQYGPVSREELDAWVADGRIDASCQLLCDGWQQWKWAEEVFTERAQKAEQPAGSDEQNPFAGIIDTGAGSTGGDSRDANPFSAPQVGATQASGARDSASGDSQLTPKIFKTLAETRPWVMLMSVLGFIGAALGALGSLGYGAMSLMAGDAGGGLSAMLGVGALFMGAVSALYGFAAYFLFQYASEISRLMRTRASLELERALIAQKSFWKFVGICTAVVMAIELMMVLLLAAGAAF